MASGWNLWVWLQCIGVVSGCCCKKVYRYPHNFPYSTCISSFLGSSIPTSLFIFKMFFRSLYIHTLVATSLRRPCLHCGVKICLLVLSGGIVHEPPKNSHTTIFMHVYIMNVHCV